MFQKITKSGLKRHLGRYVTVRNSAEIILGDLVQRDRKFSIEYLAGASDTVYYDLKSGDILSLMVENHKNPFRNYVISL